MCYLIFQTEKLARWPRTLWLRNLLGDHELWPRRSWEGWQGPAAGNSPSSSWAIGWGKEDCTGMEGWAGPALEASLSYCEHPSLGWWAPTWVSRCLTLSRRLPQLLTTHFPASVALTFEWLWASDAPSEGECHKPLLVRIWSCLTRNKALQDRG